MAGPGLLDTYHDERAPIGAAVVGFTDRAFRIATTTESIRRMTESSQ